MGKRWERQHATGRMGLSVLDGLATPECVLKVHTGHRIGDPWADRWLLGPLTRNLEQPAWRRVRSKHVNLLSALACACHYHIASTTRVCYRSRDLPRGVSPAQSLAYHTTLLFGTTWAV